MFDYPHLEVLIAVEREGSLERAAQSLQVTKSALSQTLRLLEERKGAVVLNRTTMKPTPFGARLCRHYEEVSVLEQTFFEEHVDLFDLADVQIVPLGIGVTDDALISWMTDRISECVAHRPNVLIDTVLMSEAEIRAALAEHRLSGALTTMAEPLKGFQSRHIGTHSLHAVASPGFIRHHFSEGITEETLKHAPLLRYSTDDPELLAWVKNCVHTDKLPTAQMLPSAHGIANACLDGAGWGMCSNLLIEKALSDSTLVELVSGSGIAQDLHWHLAATLEDVLSPVTAALQHGGAHGFGQPPDISLAPDE